MQVTFYFISFGSHFISSETFGSKGSLIFWKIYNLWKKSVEKHEKRAGNICWCSRRNSIKNNVKASYINYVKTKLGSWKIINFFIEYFIETSTFLSNVNNWAWNQRKFDRLSSHWIWKNFHCNSNNQAFLQGLGTVSNCIDKKNSLSTEKNSLIFYF